ncbi:pyridoxamine 5'-phosphate oxidase family protein [Nocardia sp. NBC_01327]|uniref:pyridoxamine 5'-phosphate oxidase family protein n=1 Tax=Nocardia sp. NBC_01327 TaxID=2903593 RepID=UPI002E1666BD|nr:pyridoxamine 5'-phosphate oxidase family protein [Nocardia sp. NBC_01327]
MPTPEPTLPEIQEAITDLLRTEQLATLATLDAEGHPSASAMHITADGLITYMHTFHNNRKHAQMQHNPNVSYVTSYFPPDGYTGRADIRSLQIQGRATLVTDPAEIQHAVQLSFEQFPWLADTSLYNNIKPPDQGQQVFYRIDPTRGLWSDHRIRQLWRIHLDFSLDGRTITATHPYNTPHRRP